MNTMRRWCYAIIVMFVAIAVANLEEVAQVEELRDTLVTSESPSESRGRYYKKIPGFSMTAGAAPHEVASRQECQAKCSPDSECKSYSWRRDDKTCLTSTEALSYDVNYNLYTKSANEPGEYRKFPGLVYRATGWQEITHISDTECQGNCTSLKACEAFSYSNPKDDIITAKCLLSGKAISYSVGFNYYEKKGVKVSTETADGEQTVPQPPEKETNPAVQAIMKAEKKKSETAEASTRRSARAIEKAAQEVKKAKEALAANIKSKEAAVKKEAEKTEENIQGELEAKTSSFAADQAQKTADQEEKLNLELAANAVQQKAEQKQQQTKQQQQQQAAQAAELKAKSESDEAKATLDGEEMADEVKTRQKLNDEQTKLQREKEKIAKEEAETAAEIVAAGAEIKTAKAKADMEKEADEKLTAATQKQQEVQDEEAAQAEQAAIAKARADAKNEEEKERGDIKNAKAKQTALVAVQKAEQDKIYAKKDQIQAQVQDQTRIDTEKRVQKAAEKDHAAKAEAQKAEAAKNKEEGLAVIQRDEMEAQEAGKVAELENKNNLLIAHEAAAANKRKREIKFRQAKKRQARNAAARNVAAAADEDAKAEAKIFAKRRQLEAEKLEADIKAKEEEEATKLAEMNKAAKLKATVAEQKVKEEQAQEQEDIEAEKKANAAKAKKEKEDEVKRVAAEAAAAKDAADVETQKAVALAQEEKKKTADEAAKAAREMSVSIKASEAAFTDSGKKMVGINIDKLNEDIRKAKQIRTRAAAASLRANKTFAAAEADYEVALKKSKMANQEDQASDADQAAAEKRNIEIAKNKAQGAKETNDNAAKDAAAEEAEEAEKKNSPDEKAKAAKQKKDAQKENEKKDKQKKEKEEADKKAEALADIQAAAEKAAAEKPAAEESASSLQALSLLETRESSRFHHLIKARQALFHDLVGEPVQVPAARRLLQNDAKSSNITNAPTAAPTGRPTSTPTAVPTVTPTQDPRPALAARKAEEQVRLKVLQKQKAETKQQKLLKAFEKADADEKILLAKRAKMLAMEMPANTPQGKLPEMNKQRGVLKVQNSDDHVEDTWLKFDPGSQLQAGDEIKRGVLRMFKYSGDESPAMIRIASCAWERGSITLTNSLKLAGKQCSFGTVTYPALNDNWADLILDGAALEKAKNAGQTICLQVSGGPAKGTPAIFASELTSKSPRLELNIIKGTTQDELDAIAEEKRKKEADARALKDCMEKKKEELHQQYSAEALAKVKEAQDKVERAEAAKCQAQVQIETTGLAFDALRQAALVQRADETTETINQEKKDLTGKLEAEVQTKVANSDTAEGSPERTRFKTELRTQGLKDLKAKMQKVTKDKQVEAEEAASKAATAVAAKKKKDILEKCDAATAERTKDYGKLTALQEQHVEMQVEAALPALRTKCLEEQNRTKKNNPSARLKESLHMSQQHNQVQLLDDGAAVSW